MNELNEVFFELLPASLRLELDEALPLWAKGTKKEEVPQSSNIPQDRDPYAGRPENGPQQ